MKTIEEHRNDLISKPPKSRAYIYKCDKCGSILEVDKSDIHYSQEYGDVSEYFTCPVCGNNQYVFMIKFFHLKSLRKLFNKKYR